MKKHLSLVFEKHDYPLEARDFLLTTVDRLYKNSKFVYLVENFYKDKLTNQDHIVPTLKDIINESGLCEHTVNYLYYLCVTKELREEYAKRGLPEDISLKKAYAEYLTADNQVGEGFGVFVWDPVAKKPITK